MADGIHDRALYRRRHGRSTGWERSTTSSVGEVLGSTSANVMAVCWSGICLSDNRQLAVPRAASHSCCHWHGLYFAGTLLRPLHGIIKNQATESYTLVAAGICCLLFSLFYWLIDVRNLRAWAGFPPARRQESVARLSVADLRHQFVRGRGLPHLLWPVRQRTARRHQRRALTAVVP